QAQTWVTGLGLTSHGDSVDHVVITGNSLVASTDAAPGHDVFKLTINDDGSFLFELLNPLDHATGQGENSLSFDLSGLIKAVNSFGQPATLSHACTIPAVDDVPVLAPAAPLGVADEGALPGPASPGDLFGPGNNPAGTATFSGNIEDVVAFGADGM